MSATPSSHPVTQRGMAVLNDPLLNKGTAFPWEERTALGLHGLLPPGIHTLEEQVAQAYENIMSETDMLDRHVRLRAIQDTNETLFYALLQKYLTELMPVVYTPGVGQACQEFSRIWQKPRGLFLSGSDRGHMAGRLAAIPNDDIRLVIVTDGERILGLGDLGANGMGIPIGKISLYTACAGINPALMMPIMLDVGTDNVALRNDPTYIGSRTPRLRGQDYEDFIEEFVTALQARWPGCLLHWEDFAGRNAAPLLQRYRNRIPSFNDDIQGTAGIATAAILSGLKAKGETLEQQCIAFAGGGAAGIGIAGLLLAAMKAEGLSQEEALKRFYIVDRQGLLTHDMDGLSEGQALFARQDETAQNGQGRTLAEVISKNHPTILIGVSGQAGLFKEAMIREMASYCSHPLIFPLSNPTSHVEATPMDILTWTGGRAIVSTGSPFSPVELDDRSIIIDQTNNSYIFPGLGLGALACKAENISEGMIMAAAQAVAALSPMQTGGSNLLPPIETIHDVALKVAHAVARQAQEEQLCPALDDEALQEALSTLSWRPRYQPYRAA
ncbi:NAD-dependent malic enzyme [Parasaccharibacter sp. TMW2.1882]|uniref:NAD-dependent malic enzyme n=1 Tax=Parasaccharibacter apium TaxID=1510841 RepID=A0ABX4ZNZ2_9PROT|nr:MULTISPECIES: NAD-dependent malic enzyme [Parasaccharibacter]MUG78991.1 oxaloacetate-decarboxylating malate dehydrogenase [Bombella sp. ESL0380]MCK8636298.1 NAD-dependent malic enzyme [Parasaccharibacter sp. TMW2.1885]MCL1496661.1 NAD-dependent malic enzyme [Parasaccharibacter sp. TMW2.1882]POS64382.1 NAD-dependent malic enzyme [Parasaccharibacter apium]POS64407.1 NAD-dependent malic enzyme [Parasaccharibacter apium]